MPALEEVVLSPKSFLDQYSLNVQQKINSDVHGYKDMSDAKQALLSYIKIEVNKKPNYIVNSYTEWADVLIKELDTFGKRLNEQSKELFKKVVYILVNDKNIEYATKIEVLNELYSPLKFCSSGAEGQIQSALMLIDSNSLLGQLRLFAKDIAEQAFVLSKIDNIHVRNHYLYEASIILPIIGTVEKDPYGREYIPDIKKKIQKSIEEKYTIDGFFDFIDSKISAVIPSSRLNLGAIDSDIDKIARDLKFINISKEDIGNLFLLKLKGPYAEWSWLLNNILTCEFTEYEYYNDILDLPDSRKDDYIYIVKTNEGFELLVNNKKFAVSAGNKEVYKKLVDFVENKSKQNLFSLYDIFSNKNQNKPNLKINQDFIQYKVFEGLKTLRMLSEASHDEWQPIQIDLPSGIKSSIYPFKDKCRLVFQSKDYSKYVNIIDVLSNPEDFVMLKEFFDSAGYNISQFALVGEEHGVNDFYQHNAELIKSCKINDQSNGKIVGWLTNNSLFLHKWLKEDKQAVISFLDKINYQQDCQFFSCPDLQEEMTSEEYDYLRRYFVKDLIPRLSENDLYNFFSDKKDKDSEYFYLLKLCILSQWLSLPKINYNLLKKCLLNDKKFIQIMCDSGDSVVMHYCLNKMEDGMLLEFFNLYPQLFADNDLATERVKSASLKNNHIKSMKLVNDSDMPLNNDEAYDKYINNVLILEKNIILDYNKISSEEELEKKEKNIFYLHWLCLNPKSFAMFLERQNTDLTYEKIEKYLQKNALLEEAQKSQIFWLRCVAGLIIVGLIVAGFYTFYAGLSFLFLSPPITVELYKALMLTATMFTFGSPIISLIISCTTMKDSLIEFPVGRLVWQPIVFMAFCSLSFISLPLIGVTYAVFVAPAASMFQFLALGLFMGLPAVVVLGLPITIPLILIGIYIVDYIVDKFNFDDKYQVYNPSKIYFNLKSPADILRSLQQMKNEYKNSQPLAIPDLAENQAVEQPSPQSILERLVKPKPLIISSDKNAEFNEAVPDQENKNKPNIL